MRIIIESIAVVTLRTVDAKSSVNLIEKLESQDAKRMIRVSGGISPKAGLHWFGADDIDRCDSSFSAPIMWHDNLKWCLAIDRARHVANAERRYLRLGIQHRMNEVESMNPESSTSTMQPATPFGGTQITLATAHQLQTTQQYGKINPAN